ncbi:MAG: nitrous oxide reductase family maturation protein NosD, partial [Candidatus Hodarchaeota archaeon]
MKRFTFVILLLAFFGLYSSILVLDFIVMDNSTESQCSTLNYLTKSSKAQSGYVEHEPIVISKNIDFDIYGFPGNGTAINPYRIQNLNITRAAYLIKIQNTTSHFMISSCLLNGIDKSKPGIYFSNVTNGELKHNELYNAYNGLWFERLKNSTLVNNTIQDTGRWGIVLSSCKNVTLEENKVINNVRDGIWLSKSNNCLLKNNTLTKNDIGIKNLGSPNINITLNTIYNNSEGINIAATGATTNIILANHIYNNTGDGIELGVSASSTQILNNTISNNTQYGVNLFAGSSESLVKWNYFISNNPGGSSQGYSYTTNNKFHYNYWSDWTTPDDDSNNIVDIPYSIDGYGSLIDPYPLVYTSLVTFHYLPPPTIISPNGNVVLSGNALIQWTEVVDSLDHSV